MVGLATSDRRPNLHYDLIDSSTGINYGRPPMGWRYDKRTMARLIDEKRILWPSSPDGRPRRKSFVNDLSSERTGYSSIIGSNVYTRNGTADIVDLFDNRVMDFPKPVALVEELINQVDLAPGELVLDFFSGSGTTAHSIMSLNAADGGQRVFIMVQLPEICDEKSEAFNAGYKTIAEISKERIRRAGKKILEGECYEGWNKDVGFRVLKIDSSNMADVYYTPDQVQHGDLFAQIDNLKADRSAEDLLFQVLLDWGVDLALPIRKQTIQGKTLFFVDENALVACFDTGVNEALVKELAQHQPLRVVFRDNGFASDAVKINVEQIFKQLSPGTEVKAI